MSGNEKMKSIIEMMKQWITAALTSSDYKADFSMESLKEIDRFLMSKTQRMEFYPKMQKG